MLDEVEEHRMILHDPRDLHEFRDARARQSGIGAPFRLGLLGGGADGGQLRSAESARNHQIAVGVEELALFFGQRAQIASQFTGGP